MKNSDAMICCVISSEWVWMLKYEYIKEDKKITAHVTCYIKYSIEYAIKFNKYLGVPFWACFVHYSKKQPDHFDEILLANAQLGKYFK